MNTFIASSGLGKLLQGAWGFLEVGGFFMVFLVLTSVIALTAIIFKARTLRRSRVVPRDLERILERMGRRGVSDGAMADVGKHAGDRRSVLARLCMVVLEHPTDDDEDIAKAVQSSAREEIVKMNVGLPLLETVITGAPMLGLLGTASGLVLVFSGIGPSSDYFMTSRGISEALNNTIMGLAVALVAVVSHGYFERKTEYFIARMEVLTGHLLAAAKSARRDANAAKD